MQLLMPKWPPPFASICCRIAGAVAGLRFVISVISISPWQFASHYAQSRADALLMITVTNLPVSRFIIHHREIRKERKRPSKNTNVTNTQKFTYHCSGSSSWDA